jgi:conjugal transfer pilus assembly protein TraD
MKFEAYWRPNFEAYAAAAWVAGAVIFTLIFQKTEFQNKVPFLASTAVCVVFAVWRGREAWENYTKRRQLNSEGVQIIKWGKLLPKLMQAARKDSLWLGDGFKWEAEETGRSKAIIDYGPSRLLGKHLPASKNGQVKYYAGRFLHGVGEKRGDIFLPMKYVEGQTLVVGTTGSGKTRLFDLMIAQAILRNEPVVVIDPKGDHDLKEKIFQACKSLGQEKRFVYFHPAFPDISARIDPMKNWNRPTELADRIATLIPSETGADPFKAFSWKVLEAIISGLLQINKSPNLLMLRRFVEQGVDSLLKEVLESYFDHSAKKGSPVRSPGWQKHVGTIEQALKSKRNSNPRLSALIMFYQNSVYQEYPSPEIDSLINQYSHNREHFQKMIASLIPVMIMLTSGSMGDLLSPKTCAGNAEKEPCNDSFVVTDSKQIISSSQVAYIGLDSLSDSTIGSAIGSILLADLTSAAGDLYNYSGTGKYSRINIFIDEAAEVVNVPTVQLLNKGRGAGFNVTLATQTLADFEVRTGSAAGARQILGNLNNVISLRVLDDETQKYISDGMGKVKIPEIQVMYTSGLVSSMPDELASGYRESLVKEESELVPPYFLGLLPNLNYFAKLADGTVIKGRLPIVIHEKEIPKNNKKISCQLPLPEGRGL